MSVVDRNVAVGQRADCVALNAMAEEICERMNKELAQSE